MREVGCSTQLNEKYVSPEVQLIEMNTSDAILSSATNEIGIEWEW